MEHGQRNKIIGATERGLTVRIAGRETMVPWSTVTGISAGQARPDPISEHWILVLALEMQLPDREHLSIVSEISRLGSR